ncbi:sulfatase family protein [Saccharicrinis aurantiacus]|uniref:sulfatase family protein n=1 Tax=Saccharicrinis aurantiacus TaxID=1849719 RepID=UPI00094FAE06|nr:sulfatase [Saccharicrinis aurantiacus]
MKNLSILVVLMLLLTVSCTTKKTSITKPNIIYIMSDDHCAQAIGAYKMRLAELNPTPTIDRIAKEGILFQNAFCTNAICTPSRASILTGQYSQTNGVMDLSGRIGADKQYLPKELKKLGYETAMVGKWHLKEAPEAFDYYNVLPGQGDYHNPTLYARTGNSLSTIRFEEDLVRDVYATKYEGHSSDVITNLSIDWLKNKRDKSKPFFLMHHFKAPHDFFEYADRYNNYLEDTFIPEPESMWDNKNNGSLATRGINDCWIDTIGSSIGHRNVIRNMGMHMEIDPTIPDPEYKHLAYQEYLKRYLRCVKGVDDNVSRLFQYLEENDLMDNTIIIYTGDQGFMLGEHDYIDKRWMYEESMRMPFLVRYPEKIKAGTSTDAIINNVDFAPTIIDLAGGKTPEYMQGDSFKQILFSGKEPEAWKQATYYRYWMHMAHKHNNPAHFGIRTKQYKLIFFYGRDYKARNTAAQKWAHNPESMSDFETIPAWEFYDLANDPHEMNNLYGNETFKDVIADLKIQLKDMRASINEEDGNYPAIQQIIDAHWND